MDLVKPSVIRNALYMGQTELTVIKELDVKTIERFKSRLRFYYGASDSWAPVSYFRDLTERVPGVNAQLCTNNYPHAFVLKRSEPMAEIVKDWYQSDN